MWRSCSRAPGAGSRRGGRSPRHLAGAAGRALGDAGRAPAAAGASAGARTGGAPGGTRAGRRRPAPPAARGGRRRIAGAGGIGAARRRRASAARCRPAARRPEYRSAAEPTGGRAGLGAVRDRAGSGAPARATSWLGRRLPAGDASALRAVCVARCARGRSCGGRTVGLRLGRFVMRYSCSSGSSALRATATRVTPSGRFISRTPMVCRCARRTSAAFVRMTPPSEVIA